MRFNSLMLGCFSLVAATSACATDFVGIELGKPLNMVRCVNFSYSDPAVYMKPGYGTQPVRPCWIPQDNKSDAEVRASGMYAVFVQTDFPDGVDRLMPILFDGAVEVVVAETRGVAVQESLAAALAKKYGEPTKYEVEHPSNAFGATFPSIRAEWKLPEAEVAFVGVRGNVKNGLITIMTPRGKQQMQAQAEAEQGARVGF